MSLIMIIVTTALVNNVVLSQFLGICSFLGVSSQKKASLSLGLAVTAVLTVSSAVASLLYDHVLQRGLLIWERGILHGAAYSRRSRSCCFTWAGYRPMPRLRPASPRV